MRIIAIIVIIKIATITLSVVKLSAILFKSLIALCHGQNIRTFRYSINHT